MHLPCMNASAKLLLGRLHAAKNLDATGMLSRSFCQSQPQQTSDTEESSEINTGSSENVMSQQAKDTDQRISERFPTYFTHSERNLRQETFVQERKAWRERTITPPKHYRHVFPEFLPNHDRRYRHFLMEKVERMDMLKRRSKLDVPEFYVGSVLAVTSADQGAIGKVSRFVGICLQRKFHGLRHAFTLRNHMDGEGVEITYDLYNPNIRKIEVLKLQKAQDDHMVYLRDAPAEHSTFDFSMRPVQHPPGAPVPVITEKVPLNPPPWYAKWYGFNLEGVDYNTVWPHVKPVMYKKWQMRGDFLPFDKYDLMKEYRKSTTKEDQDIIYSQVHEHQLEMERQKREEMLKPRPEKTKSRRKKSKK